MKVNQISYWRFLSYIWSANEKYLMGGSQYLMATAANVSFIFIVYRISRLFEVEQLFLLLSDNQKKMAKIYHSLAGLWKCEVVLICFVGHPFSHLNIPGHTGHSSREKNYLSRPKLVPLATNLWHSQLLFSSCFFSHVQPFKCATFLLQKTFFSPFQFSTTTTTTDGSSFNQWWWTQINFFCYFLPSRIHWQPSDVNNLRPHKGPTKPMLRC